MQTDVAVDAILGGGIPVSVVATVNVLAGSEWLPLPLYGTLAMLGMIAFALSSDITPRR